MSIFLYCLYATVQALLVARFYLVGHPDSIGINSKEDAVMAVAIMLVLAPAVTILSVFVLLSKGIVFLVFENNKRSE